MLLYFYRIITLKSSNWVFICLAWWPIPQISDENALEFNYFHGTNSRICLFMHGLKTTQKPCILLPSCSIIVRMSSVSLKSVSPRTES